MSGFRHGLTPKMKPIGAKKSAIVAALDIGTTKVVCAIARLRPREPRDVLPNRTHQVEIIGVGHVRSEGIKAGAVVDLGRCETAIRNAVDLAERQAGVQLEAAVVGLTAGRLASERFAAAVPIPDTAVAEADIQRVLQAGSRHAVAEGRVVLHSLPNGYTLDDTRQVEDPRGMIGRRLSLDVHVVTADVAAARNLMLAVERCHLKVEAMAATPYGAALSVLTADEAEIGVAVVDLGGGTTTTAVFEGGYFAGCDGVALGGHHVTMDLARGLSTRIHEAERLKTLYGGVILCSSDERETVSVPVVGEDDNDVPRAVPRAELLRIIRPRVEEILELVRDRLRRNFGGEAGRRVVFTGGAAQLTGLQDLATKILGCQVRVGRPLGVKGLGDEHKVPTFAAVTGMLVYPQVAAREHYDVRRVEPAATGTDGYFSGVSRWLRENF
jgi:cell division protein FtsA